MESVIVPPEPVPVPLAAMLLFVRVIFPPALTVIVPGLGLDVLIDVLFRFTLLLAEIMIVPSAGDLLPA